MQLHRIIATTTAITALAATGVAGAAEAPVVSKQHDIAGAAPFAIPGTGIAKGEYMGAKGILALKAVTLEDGQTARVTLKATGKRRIAGVGVPEGQRVGVTVVGGDYVGKKQVTVRVFLEDSAPEGEHVGLIGALTK